MEQKQEDEALKGSSGLAPAHGYPTVTQSGQACVLLTPLETHVLIKLPEAPTQRAHKMGSSSSQESRCGAWRGGLLEDKFSRGS